MPHSVLSATNSRNRAPQSSCAQLRLLYATFNPLADAARIYLTKIPTRLLNGAFPGQFSRFSDGFDSFTRIATRALSPLEPSAVPRLQPTSALAQSAKALEQYWADCFDSVESIAASGAGPLLAETGARLDEIAELLNRADQSFKATQARSSLEATPIAPLGPLLQKAKIEFEAKGNVEGHVLEFAETTRVLFDQALPLYFRAPSELSWYRTQVIEKCAQIAELWRSWVEFESTVDRLRAAAVRFNVELRELHRALNLPYEDSSVRASSLA
jgi:hypothetical protein